MKRGSSVNRLLDRYLGIPILYGTSLFHQSRSRPQYVRKIGVFASPTLGDTLLSSAAICDLQSHFVDADIIYFSTETNAAAVALLPGVTEIVNISITKPLSTIRTMRHCDLDILIDLTPWQRVTAFYSAFSAARYRVGFRSDRQHRHWHYDLLADHRSTVHELENYRNLLRVLGLKAVAQPKLNLPQLPLTFEDDSAANTIIFHPWAGGEQGARREWPTSNWLKLARRLQNDNALFIVSGSLKDRARSEMLIAQLRAEGLKADCYQASDGLVSLGQMLSRAYLVVSVNTGIMHLAAILGARTVSLNGPTATHRWGPVGPRALSVEPKNGKGGFLHFGFEFAGNPTNSMEEITVNDTLKAINNLFEIESTKVCTSSLKAVSY